MNIGRKILTVAQRLAATTVDVVLIFSLVAGTLALLAVLTASYNNIDTSIPIHFGGSDTVSWSHATALSIAPFFFVLLPLVWLLYEAILTKVWNGTTVGKLLFRVRATSLHGNLSIWQCFFRTTLKILCVMLVLSVGEPLALVFVLAAFIAVPLFTVKTQFLFDLLASTTVIKRTA